MLLDHVELMSEPFDSQVSTLQDSQAARGRSRTTLTGVILRPISRAALAVLLLFVLVGSVHFATLLHFIKPEHDDAWFVSRASALIKTGHAFGQLDVGVLNNFDGHSAYFWYVG